GLEQPVHAGEVGGVVLDADVLDDADGGDLVEADIRGQIAVVEMVDARAAVEPGAVDRRLRPFRLRARQRDAVRLDAVALRGPHDQAAPATADVEEPLARLEAELPADEIELVLLRPVEIAVGTAVV